MLTPTRTRCEFVLRGAMNGFMFAIQKCDEFFCAPHMVDETSLHRRSNAQGLMNPAKVVIQVCALRLRWLIAIFASHTGDLVRAALDLSHRALPVTAVRVHQEGQKQSAFKVQ